MVTFNSKNEARRVAVEDPSDVSAFSGGYWPPYDRAEMMRVPGALRRITTLAACVGSMTDLTLSPRFLLWRLQELAKVFAERATRHKSATSWSLTLSNNRTVRFPLDDPSAVVFKDMAGKFSPYYEKALADYLIDHLGPGDVFVDVGANVGYVSAIAASTGAVVFAVEIQRDLITQIEAMAVLNEFDLVRPLHLGMSSENGLTSIWRTGINLGAGLEGQTTRARQDEPRSIADDFVPMMALDDVFVGEAMRPKIVKIDVEGHEIDVLAGARRLIEARKTTFIVEYHDHMISLFGRRPEELIAAFGTDGWRWSQLTDDGLIGLTGMDDVQPDDRDPNPKLVFEPC
jgi:FkbM family methyltransferase